MRPELVGIAEIARRLEVRPNVVSNWVSRHESFPEPEFTLSMGSAWDWDEVESWHDARKHTGRQLALDEG